MHAEDRERFFFNKNMDDYKMKNCLNCKERYYCNTFKKIVECLIEDNDKDERSEAFASEEKETFFCTNWKEDK